FLLLSLTQEEAAAPALEGLRTGQRRARRALEAWLDAVALVAGPDGAALRPELAGHAARFLRAFRATAQARPAGRAPLPGRRRPAGWATRSAGATARRASSRTRIPPRARCSAPRATVCSAATRWRTSRRRRASCGGRSSTP